MLRVGVGAQKRVSIGAIFLGSAICADALPPAGGWIETEGNACAVGFDGKGPSPCGCSASGCKDMEGFKYKGTKASAAACEATCKGSEDCSIWIWSKSSTHCWWRTDGYWAPSSNKGAQISGCNAAVVKGCAGPAPKPPAPPLAPFVAKWTTTEPNMNGGYPLSATPKADLSKFPKGYKDFPVGEGIGGIEFFDMYSPLFSQLYSQVCGHRPASSNEVFCAPPSVNP
jgi:hypothetical protein